VRHRDRARFVAAAFIHWLEEANPLPAGLQLPRAYERFLDYILGRDSLGKAAWGGSDRTRTVGT